MIQESKEAAQKCAVASKYDDGAHVSKFPPTTVPELNRLLARSDEEKQIYESVDRDVFKMSLPPAPAAPNGATATCPTSSSTCANYDAELSKLVKELDALESAQRMAKVSSLTAENMEYLVGAKRLMAIEEVPDALKYEEESASSVSAEQDVGGTPSESTSSSSSSEPSEEDEKGA